MRHQTIATLSAISVIVLWGTGCKQQEQTAGKQAAKESSVGETNAKEPQKTGDPREGETMMTIQIRSTAFDQGRPIPRKYTGEGEDISPELNWSGIPEKTKEIALIVDDPDAPRPQPWVHWVLYKIPADTTSLREGIPHEERLKDPAGALQGPNSGGKIGYMGPMPPPGHGVHHYHFKLYALDAPVDAQPGLGKDELLATMKGHIIAEGELMGTYKR